MPTLAKLLPIRTSLPPLRALPLLALAALSFHLAYQFPPLSFLMLLFLASLIPLAQLPTARQTFYTGLLLGLALYAPQLAFFSRIFGPFAISLYLLLALNPALFLLAAHCSFKKLPKPFALLTLPILWTGIEYFRCELWYLRFAWLTPGLAFSQVAWLQSLGSYGISFTLLLLVIPLYLLPKKFLTLGLTLLLLTLAITTNIPPTPAPAPPPNSPFVTGIQLEDPSESEVLHNLTSALHTYPQTDLFVLSEYTFATPIPDSILTWCKTNHRHLIVGGTDPDPKDPAQFTNTAFVIGPAGTVIFKQGKSVPIQFFSDGLPASSQSLWHSPWGNIGLCICYDLSYTRITDALIRQGAQALIVPTMDVTSWGLHEHQLHARIAPARAAEYHLPIFRLCSSGISELALPNSALAASAPYPGQSQTLTAYLPMNYHPTLPPDRQLAPLCTALAILLPVALALTKLIRLTHRRARM